MNCNVKGHPIESVSSVADPSVEQVEQEARQYFAQAAKAGAEGNQEAFETALAHGVKAYMQRVQDAQEDSNERFEQLRRELAGKSDDEIVASRGHGFRQLTAEELTWAKNLAHNLEQVYAGNPRQALASVDTVLPETEINNVFDDMVQEHPLLKMISFTPCNAKVRVYMNTDEGGKAVWGQITDEVATEAVSGFKDFTNALCSLSTFIYVPRAYLTLGPVWLERYVRMVLADRLANSLEDGYINGDGNIKPIGMRMSVATGITSEDTVKTGVTYTAKPEEKLTEITPESYGKLISRLIVARKDKDGNPVKYRNLPSEVMFLCHPSDYLTTVMPAVTTQTSGGAWVAQWPYATQVVTSQFMALGKAIVGLPKRYMALISGGPAGSLEHSDEFEFLKRLRTYLVQLFAWGAPMDDYSFIPLDISELKPLVLKVSTVSGGTAQEGTGGAAQEGAGG